MEFTRRELYLLLNSPLPRWLVGADPSGADLHRVDLSGAILTRANLERAIVTKASLRGADLTDARMEGSDLTGANLEGADLSNACMIDAKLADADLRQADLRGAHLRGAELRGTIPTQANFYQANLEGATLTADQLAEALSTAVAVLPDGNPTPASFLSAAAELQRGQRVVCIPTPSATGGRAPASVMVRPWWQGVLRRRHRCRWPRARVFQNPGGKRRRCGHSGVTAHQKGMAIWTM